MRPDFVKNKRDYAKTFKFLVDTTVQVLDISVVEASIRVNQLMKLPILNADPHDPFTQYRIDKFLLIPSRDHAKPLPFLLQSDDYRDAFVYSITKEEVVKMYQRVTGADAKQVMNAKISESLDMDKAELVGPLAQFERFFRRSIWMKYQKDERKNG